MKNKVITETHQFALFSASFTVFTAGMQVDITNPLLMHRIARVLRLEVGERCILFNRSSHAVVRIETIDKKKMRVVVEQVDQNQLLTPAITCYVPLLKKEALEQALYACVELGATQIKLVKTQKIHRVYTDKELDHARGCMIAAAEQSKNFAFPTLDSTLSLEEVLKEADSKTLIFCDPSGKSLLDVLNALNKQRPTHIGIMVGPEGDLTVDEKELLLKNKVIFCALTPTVLRSQDALMIGLGALRSISNY